VNVRPERSGIEGLPGRLAEVRHRIESLVGDPRSIRIVAVTKGFGPEAALAALGAGLVELGENYADELVAKAGLLAGDRDGADLLAGDRDGAGLLAGDRDGAGLLAPALEPAWHFLGAVQRNKVARLAPLVACWQGVCRLQEGQAIARRRPGATVLVQLDVAGLPGRGGCDPERAPELVAALRDEDLDVAGLMAVGPPGRPEAARPGFALLSNLADSLDLPVRSMGMSDDLEVALSEGSTMVRLGRALFGDRAPRAR
jgi:PLP dependent protein